MKKVLVFGLGKNGPLNTLRSKEYIFFEYDGIQALEYSVKKLENFIEKFDEVELIGHSLGATIALIVGMNNPNVKKIFSIAPILLETCSLEFDKENYAYFHGLKIHKSHFESLCMDNVKKLIKKTDVTKKTKIIIPMSDKNFNNKKMDFIRRLVGSSNIQKIDDCHDLKNTLINSLLD